MKNPGSSFAGDGESLIRAFRRSLGVVVLLVTQSGGPARLYPDGTPQELSPPTVDQLLVVEQP